MVTCWIDLNTFVNKAETSTEPAAPKYGNPINSQTFVMDAQF